MAQYGSMTLREREDKSRVRKKNEGQDGDSKEVKKARVGRRFDRTSRAKFDEKGHDKETGLDLCDCLEENCPGCWMDCPRCGSRKCGHECRCYRRYKYESVDIEGSDVTLRYKKN